MRFNCNFYGNSRYTTVFMKMRDKWKETTCNIMIKPVSHLVICKILELLTGYFFFFFCLTREVWKPSMKRLNFTQKNREKKTLTTICWIFPNNSLSLSVFSINCNLFPSSLDYATLKSVRLIITKYTRNFENQIFKRFQI